MGLLIDMTLREFNTTLASSQPAPGGGSTAALASLLGAALTIMVEELSRGRKFFEALDDSIKTKISSDVRYIKELNENLLSLVDEDTQAFNSVMEAMKLPKVSMVQQAERAKAIEIANAKALDVPLLVAEKSVDIMRCQYNIARYGNKNAASDIGVAVIMAHAGLEGALLNVKINMCSISDKKSIDSVYDKIKRLASEGAALKMEILEIVNIRINDC